MMLKPPFSLSATHGLSKDDHQLTSDQRFAINVMKTLLFVDNQDEGLDRLMALIHRTFPEMEVYLFSLHEQNHLYLIRSIPASTLPAQNLVFPLLTQETEPNGRIDNLQSLDKWQASYAAFFPDVKQCILFSANVNARRYTMMVTSSSPDFWQEAYLQQLYYGLDVIKLVLDYMASTEILYGNVEHIQQREKFASLGRLAAGVAHEINNPLAFTMSNVSTLSQYVSQFKAFVNDSASDKASLMKEMVKDSEAILSETYQGLIRIQHIVASLNVYDHESGFSQRLVDLRDVVSTALSMIHGEIKQRAEIECIIPEMPFYITGYSTGLQQVVIHLVMNALQSIVHSEGKVSVNLELENHGLLPRKRNICLLIEDNGKGISEDDLNHIFEPFFTTKTVGLGAGLGLSVAKEIVEEHQGQISIESTLGQGTRAYIRLPCVVGMT